MLVESSTAVARICFFVLYSVLKVRSPALGRPLGSQPREAVATVCSVLPLVAAARGGLSP